MPSGSHGRWCASPDRGWSRRTTGGVDRSSALALPGCHAAESIHHSVLFAAPHPGGFPVAGKPVDRDRPGRADRLGRCALRWTVPTVLPGTGQPPVDPDDVVARHTAG
ncbi:hypothetical protein ACWD5Q_08335 [Streptomyces sp. NPDC002513]